MSNEKITDSLDAVLDQVPENRRAVLKRLLLGAIGTAALPLILSESLAQPAPPPLGKGLIGRALLKGALAPDPYPPSKGGWGGGKGGGSGKGGWSGGGGKGGSGIGKGGKGSF